MNPIIDSFVLKEMDQEKTHDLSCMIEWSIPFVIWTRQYFKFNKKPQYFKFNKKPNPMVQMMFLEKDLKGE